MDEWVFMLESQTDTENKIYYIKNSKQKTANLGTNDNLKIPTPIN